MIAKKQRLTTRAFHTFFAEGKKIHTPLFTAVYTPHATLHVSVVVSKKVARRAVDRNKLRRRVYNAVRTYVEKHNSDGVFIFLMKKEAFKVEYAVLKDGIETFLNKTIA
ncbi:ribonuclease P protein component [Candidatus Kaiserbacteria bacterium]|nr:ribonuclease P protein component [Candidatus Kaiserbacteria bacterium]